MPARDGSGLAEGWLTFAELKDLCGHLNKDGMFDPATSPRKVTILDHTGMIANVKLEAAWGVDYIHLTKFSGRWMIVNVIREMGSHEQGVRLAVLTRRAATSARDQGPPGGLEFVAITCECCNHGESVPSAATP